MTINYGEEDLVAVTLEELKAQMRVDFPEDDEIITLYGTAAQNTIFNMLRRSYLDLTGFNGSVHAPVKTAILILAAHLYKNREAVASVAQNAVPYSISVLIKPYIKLSRRDEEGEGGEE